MAKATINSVQRSMEVLQDVYLELSKTVTVYSLGTNQTWPYVTYPYWNEMVTHVQDVTAMTGTSTALIVNDPVEWVKYSQENAVFPISPVVWEIEDGKPVPLTEAGDYVVIWQMHIDPNDPNGYAKFFINFNVKHEATFKTMEKHIQRFHRGIVSDFLVPQKLDPKYLTGSFGGRSLKDPPKFSEQVAETGNQTLSASTPLSIYGQPIFESLEPDANIVGYVEGYVSWNSYFDNVLLKQDEGIYVVVSNSCNGVRTWLVKANYSEYLGDVSYNCSLSRCQFVDLKILTHLVSLRYRRISMMQV
jgi:hypothetical protein